MQQSLANYYNNLRQSQAQESYAARNQPINEVTALMSGSQATVPQFQPFQGSPVAGLEYRSVHHDNYKAQSAAASQEQRRHLQHGRRPRQDDADGHEQESSHGFRWWRRRKSADAVAERGPDAGTAYRRRRQSGAVSDPFDYGKFQNFLPDIPSDGSKAPLAHGLTPDMFTYKSPGGVAQAGVGDQINDLRTALAKLQSAPAQTNNVEQQPTRWPDGATTQN